jgi:undecaprenyl diphosphate synthase
MQSSTSTTNYFALQSNIHVAIIMDGNGRWAERRGLPRIAGHRAGAAAARRVVEHALDLGIRRLSLYAFSSDNWRRPALEVQGIFWLLRGYLRLERERLRKNGARLEVIGRRDRLPKALLREIEEVETATARGRRIQIRIAVDYSSRDAIAQAALGISSASDVERSSLTGLLGHLLAGNHDGTDDVDLLIRTGGEQRLSDFLLWESAYAELIFLDVMWPDFSAVELESALEVFRQRQRRFGGIPTLSAQCPGAAAAPRHQHDMTFNGSKRLRDEQDSVAEGIRHFGTGLCDPDRSLHGERCYR